MLINKELERIAKTIKSIESSKILIAFSFLVGLKQGASSDNTNKEFYLFIQQLIYKRSKEIKTINTYGFILDVQVSSSVFINIIDMASLSKNKIGMNNLAHYLESMLLKNEITSEMAYSIGQNLYNHFMKVAKVNKNFKQYIFENNEKYEIIKNIEKFFERIIKSKRILNCLSIEKKEKKTYFENIMRYGGIDEENLIEQNSY